MICTRIVTIIIMMIIVTEACRAPGFAAYSRFGLRELTAHVRCMSDVCLRHMSLHYFLRPYVSQTYPSLSMMNAGY